VTRPRTDTPYPPFEFGKPPKYDGFDIDMVNAIAKDLGLKTDFQDAAFETIFTDVAQGKFDLVASASTITPERQAKVNFSDPYYSAQQALLVPKGSDIATVEDLAGKTVAAQDGTTGETYANDETDAGDVLTNGQVEATIIDEPVARDAIKKGQGGGFEIATTIPTGELYGLAMSKKSPELLTAVNGALAKFKEDGTLNSIYQKWFTTDAPKDVIDGTTTNP